MTDCFLVRLLLRLGWSLVMLDRVSLAVRLVRGDYAVQ